MKYYVIQDKEDRTHVHWEISGVTANMIDWFWCNLEKCNFDQHSRLKFEWMPEHGIVEKQGPLDAVYTMTQEWYDGTEIQNYLRIETLDHVPGLLTELIRYDHVVALGGISVFGDNVEPDDPAFVWRLHQWQKTDDGVMGITSAYSKPGTFVKSGQAWANQTIEKLLDWEQFLPETYRNYVVKENDQKTEQFSFKVNEQLKYCI